MKFACLLLTLFGLCTSLCAADNATNPIYSVDFSKPFIRASHNVDDINVGPSTYYNHGHGNSWVLHQQSTSYVEIIFTKSAEAVGVPILNIRHLATLVQGKAYSPVEISINGKVFVDRFDPGSNSWRDDTFDLSGWLVDGKNSVKIRLCKDAIGNYWISRLSVEIKPKGWWFW